jgi:Cu(I)/Ag(I) efflux system periplasmic protein CusF
MNRIIPLIAALTMGAVAPAFSQQQGPEGRAAGATAGKAADNFVEGEVKKIDKDAGKITLKHGPIPNLEMPGMTMVFRAKDPSALDKLKVGDIVKFKAEKIDGNITVTEYKPAS